MKSSEPHTIGISRADLSNHASLLRVNHQIPWREIKNSYVSSRNYPLSYHFIRRIKDRLLETEHSTLWRLDHPDIVIYRHLNGEYKQFLITNTRHICEHGANAIWYGAFPFIHNMNSTIHFSYDQAKIHDINYDLAWLPQSDNYSHFLCDSFASWIPFADSNVVSENIRILGFKRYSNWQAEFIDKLKMKIDISINLRPSELCVIKPNSVLLPIHSNPLVSQFNLKRWIENEYGQQLRNQIIKKDIPILFDKR